MNYYHSANLSGMTPHPGESGTRLLGMHYHGIDLAGTEHRIVSLGQVDYLVVHPKELIIEDVIELAPGSIGISGSNIELKVNQNGRVGGKAVCPTVMDAVLAIRH